MPPPKQRTKPIRQTRDFNKFFQQWKIKWKELKKENLDGPAKFLYFFNDVPRKNSLEPYKNIILCFKNWNVLHWQKIFS